MSEKDIIYWMRRKSMNSLSEVSVNTAVTCKVRPLGFFPLGATASSVVKPHSIDSVTSTGPPPLDLIATSLISREKLGSSRAAVIISRPNGGRRFRSCIGKYNNKINVDLYGTLTASILSGSCRRNSSIDVTPCSART